MQDTARVIHLKLMDQIAERDFTVYHALLTLLIEKGLVLGGGGEGHKTTYTACSSGWPGGGGYLLYLGCSASCWLTDPIRLGSIPLLEKCFPRKILLVFLLNRREKWCVNGFMQLPSDGFVLVLPVKGSSRRLLICS